MVADVLVTERGTFAVSAPGYAARLKWPVFPICWPGDLGECACGRRHSDRDAGKAPLPARGHLSASTDPQQIEAWARQYPDANLGVDLAGAGLLVLDLDSPAAIAEADGHGTPLTATARTGKGEHRYFRLPEGVPQARAIHRGASRSIDVLSAGYAVLPESRHRSGAIYTWLVAPSSFRELPLAPGWVTDLLADDVRPVPAAGGQPPFLLLPTTEPPVRLTGIDQALWEGKRWAKTETGTVDRSQTMFQLAQVLAGKGADLQQIASALAGWDRAQTDPKYATRKDAQKRYLETAQRALEASLRSRVTVGDEEERDQTYWCDRYLATYPDTAYGAKRWRRYRNGLWEELDELEIEKETKHLIKRESGKANLFTVRQVVGFTKAEQLVRPEKWDGAANLLVCANGTIDLDTGTYREHRPQDYAIAGVPYAYDPDAGAPTWRSFLASQLPDAQEFLQEFAGYCLTSDTSHELTLWLYAPPGTGKSTFLMGLKAMLGDLAGVLSLRNISSSNFALAKLPGKRLMVAMEQPSGYLDCSDTLNAIVSGDPILVEEKFRDAVEIRSTAKLAWAMNELPRVSASDNGIFRRVRIVTLPPLLERDPAIKERIAREGPGILIWALEGLQRLQARGHFLIPPSVSRAVDEFQASNDVAASFLAERCRRDPAQAIRPTALYNAYRNWCDNNGYKAKNRSNVAEDWARLGLRHVMRAGLAYWCGVALLDPTTAPDTLTLEEGTASGTAA